MLLQVHDEIVLEVPQDGVESREIFSQRYDGVGYRTFSSTGC